MIDKIIKIDDDKIKEIRDAMFDIPFGNSQFQIEQMVLNEETPERKYRKILLQLNGSLTALTEAKFRRKRAEIDLLELNDNLQKETNNFNKERIKIDIEEKEVKLNNEIKFINDAVCECAIYYNQLKKLPSFSRKEFEQSEPIYWEKRLIKDALCEIQTTQRIDTATLKALNGIGIMPKKEGNTLTFSKITNIEKSLKEAEK